MVEPADRSAIVASTGPPQFVPAAQLAQSQQQLAALQSHVTQAVDEYKSAYPMQLKFDYTFKANEAPFDIQSIYHDDKFTYIKTNAPEKFSVYEMKDGKPNLITYDLREGTYIIPKVMDIGYVELGKKRMEFTRRDNRDGGAQHPTGNVDHRMSRNSGARKDEPKGVLQKNLKMLVYLGVAVLVIVAAIFSSTGKKTQRPTKGQPPQPMVQDNTDNNVQDLKNQLQAEREKSSSRPPQRGYGGQPYRIRNDSQPRLRARRSLLRLRPRPALHRRRCSSKIPAQQLTPEQQQEQQLAAKERELAYNARFASNLAYARPTDPPHRRKRSQGREASHQTAIRNSPPSPNSSLIAPRAAGEPAGGRTGSQNAPKK